MLLPWIQERGILSRQNVITQIGTQPGHWEENYSSLPAKCQGRANDLHSAPHSSGALAPDRMNRQPILSVSSSQQPHLPRTSSHPKMTAPIGIPTASCPPQPESRVPWVHPALAQPTSQTLPTPSQAGSTCSDHPAGLKYHQAQILPQSVLLQRHLNLWPTQADSL